MVLQTDAVMKGSKVGGVAKRLLTIDTIVDRGAGRHGCQVGTQRRSVHSEKLLGWRITTRKKRRRSDDDGVVLGYVAGKVESCMGVETRAGGHLWRLGTCVERELVPPQGKRCDAEPRQRRARVHPGSKGQEEKKKREESTALVRVPSVVELVMRNEEEGCAMHVNRT